MKFDFYASARTGKPKKNAKPLGSVEVHTYAEAQAAAKRFAPTTVTLVPADDAAKAFVSAEQERVAKLRAQARIKGKRGPG